MSTPQWALDRIFYEKERKSTQLRLIRDNSNLEPLKEVPSGVFDLHWLTRLDLSNNEFNSLPEAITELQNLTSLRLSNNQFADLPEPITRLRKLTHLFLDSNQLTNLPDETARLRDLTYLHLSDNQLTSLPEVITQLRKLTCLYLNNNELTTLPEAISNLEKLSELYLNNNQLAIPPQEVSVKGTDAIRKYFRQVKKHGQERLYEAKLLILGEGEAGKTTFVKKLTNTNYQLQREPSTKGVDVTIWHFPMADSKTFRVNLWDFGGQEIYHSTHQFFLTKRSLYVLVADTRKEDTDFYYWLNMVELLSENSPLMIVSNEKDDRQRELNERQLRGRFDNLKEVLPVNFATNRGLDQLKNAIQHYTKQLPHIGSLLPTSWVRVRERLEQDPRDHIPLQEYFDICRENGFADEKDSMQLSGYLNDIGVFLHFQEEPILNKIIILKPKWGTDAVYNVLDNKIIIQNKGRFTRDDLKSIWNTPAYITMRDELLQLMMKFKLCYEIPGEKGTYIAPQLLSENQLEYVWDENQNLLLRYQYEFMPKGILLQLIVALNSMIWEQNIWRSGVIFEKDNTRSEVIELYDKREIRIRVAGAHKKELMTIVLYELDKIHAAYKTLKYDKLIPCNCAGCKEKQEPYFYRFERLQKFIEDRQDKIQCQQSYTMVDVRSLIDDVLEEMKTTREEDRPAPFIQNNYYGDHIDQRRETMTQNNQTIQGSTVHGSVVAAENIKDSFNVIEKASIQDDLKQQLKELAQAVEAMTQALPKEQAEEVADDMKRLADEATKPAPNKKWYSVSIEGLTKAAQNLGQVGEPVVKLAAKVLALLMAGG